MEKSLAAIPANRSTRAGLAELGEPEIEATLARVARNKDGHATEADDDHDPDRTGTLAVGGSTGDGQRFRLLRPHARGGLGEVFVALDCELHREVALKQILEKHADDPVSRQRFVLEAEVTGGLEHPGIVPVYGLGTYGSGRPYYAMRFIKGDSLKEAIDGVPSAGTNSPSPLVGEGQGAGPGRATNPPGSRDLALRKLLRRFLDICNAIDYAHSRGVIHRDIKPANIILGKHGETLVVDWGLAKAVGRADPSVGEQTIAPSSSGSSETMPGSAMGTPAYMSPEQACGDLDRLGPRSDVYSLGATLYCLLTGKPPFEGEDVGEILRKVQRGDFVPPRQREPSLDAALEAVCLKAMANQPGDRYPSCRALADDVERWMADEPVSAWAEPWTRKLSRWLTRHRTGVTGAAAAVLAGVVGLSAVLAVQARANASLADKNTALTAANAKIEARYNLAVDAIKTFHTGVSEDFLLKEEKFKELRDRLLKSAADFYGKLGALLDKETDIASRRALAQSNFELADLTSKVGRNEDALAAHRAVLAAREALAAEPGAGALAKVDVGRSLIAVAGLLEATGKTDEALASYRRSESLLAGPAGADPSARAARRPADRDSGCSYPPRASPPTPWRCTVWRRPTRRRWPTSPGPRTTPAANSRTRSIGSASCCRTRTTGGRGGRASARRWRSTRSWPPTTPPSPNSAVAWRTATTTSAGCCRRRASRRRRRPSSARRWRSSRSWPTTTPPSPNSAEAWRRATTTWAICCRRQASRRRRRPSTARRWRSTRNSPTTTPPSPNSAAASRGATAPRPPAVEHGQAGGGGGRVPQGNGAFQKLADDNAAVTGLRPAVSGFRSSLADSHFNLGIVLLNAGKPAEAEAEYRKALEIQQKLVDDNPSVVGFRRGLSHVYLRVASLQAWFGQDKELSSTCEKLLSLAKDTEDAMVADRAAKCCSLRQADPKRREAALVLARRAVEHGKGSRWLAYFEMALGMAEYRSGHFAEADTALTAAMNDPSIKIALHQAPQRSTARWACFDRARPSLPASSRPRRPRR